MVDFPRLRASDTCPRCTTQKDHGLVICRNCNRILKAHYDGTWGPWEGKLAVIEGGMEAAKTGADPILTKMNTLRARYTFDMERPPAMVHRMMRELLK